MAREKMEEAWWHTASLAAGVSQLFSKKAVDPKEFHPFHMTIKKQKTSGLTVKEFNEAMRAGNWRFR